MTTQLRPPGRFSRTVSGGARRLEGHRTMLGLIVAAIGLALGYIAWVSVNGVPFQDRYELSAVIPADSPILKEGDAVRIAGRLAGLITDVEPYEGDVKVEMELEPDFAPVGEDASTNVRVKSLVYLTYLEIYPGNLSDPMPEGGTIPVSRSGSGVDLLEVVDLFDRRAREALSRSVYDAGVGVAHRGTELNVALADLPAAARNTTAQLEAATSQPGAIARALRGAAATASGLRGVRPDDVLGLVVSGSVVADAVARAADPLGRAIDLLRPVEDELLASAPSVRHLFAEITGLSRKLAPAIADLRAALPQLNSVLARGDEIRTQTHRLTSAMNPVLASAPPVLRALRPTVASIEPLLEPLGALTDRIAPYADDIRISSEQLISATTTRYPEGTSPGSSALRFAPIFTCHRPRQPYPAPGEALTHSESGC
jgi:ABC-type transporter Mla subunit MlaD